MADRIRVVLDLDLLTGRPKYRELAFHLAQAVEDYQTAAHGDATLTVTSVRAPDEHQTFQQARELYSEEAFRQWQTRHRKP